jgi:hypothetical protein
MELMEPPRRQERQEEKNWNGILLFLGALGVLAVLFDSREKQRASR